MFVISHSIFLDLENSTEKGIAILSEEKQDPQQSSEKKYDTNEKEATSPCLVRIAE